MRHTIRAAAGQWTLLVLLAAMSGLSAAQAAGISKGPYLQKPTTDGITVCWVSDADSTGSVSVKRAGNSPAAVQTQKDEKPGQYHKVRIEGLKPYTRYLYTVECEGQKEEGTFLTAAPVGQAFKFVAYGDNRTNADEHAKVLTRIQTFHPDFVINTGDLVADGTKDNLWTEFFKVAGDVLRTIPYYPALGNHERDGLAYLKYFDVPRDYSFDYGDVHFTALDSNRPEEEREAQNEWLKKDLAAHQGAKWRVVFFHHTPYTCVTTAGRREAAEKLRARWEPILIAGKVQLVVNGHDHNYQHHFANGIHYVVTGGGGAPLYEVVKDTPFVKEAKMVHNDCEITVSKLSISIRAVEPDGAVIEKFAIK